MGNWRLLTFQHSPKSDGEKLVASRKSLKFPFSVKISMKAHVGTMDWTPPDCRVQRSLRFFPFEFKPNFSVDIQSLEPSKGKFRKTSPWNWRFEFDLWSKFVRESVHVVNSQGSRRSMNGIKRIFSAPPQKSRSEFDMKKSEGWLNTSRPRGLQRHLWKPLQPLFPMNTQNRTTWIPKTHMFSERANFSTSNSDQIFGEL